MSKLSIWGKHWPNNSATSDRVLAGRRCAPSGQHAAGCAERWARDRTHLRT